MTEQILGGSRWWTWVALIVLALFAAVLSGFAFVKVDIIICGEAHGQNAAGGGAAIGMMAVAIMLTTFTMAIGWALIWSFLAQLPSISYRARLAVIGLYILSCGVLAAVMGLVPVNLLEVILPSLIAIVIVLSILAHRSKRLEKLSLGKIFVQFLIFPVVWAIVSGIFSYSCVA